MQIGLVEIENEARALAKTKPENVKLLKICRSSEKYATSTRHHFSPYTGFVINLVTQFVPTALSCVVMPSPFLTARTI